MKKKQPTIEAMVKELLNKNCHGEAIQILSLCSDAEKEFRKYYNKKSYNVCCLVLDFWKDHLVKEKKMKKKKGDQFGGFGKLGK